MQIKEKLSTISRAYKGLTAANKSFVFAVSGLDGFRNLIEQRNLIIEDLDAVTEDLIREISEFHPEISFPGNSLPEALLALMKLDAGFSAECDEIKNDLQELVESDAALEKDVGSLRDDIKAEIGRIRQGARGLRGYRQVETLGSCFIDKIK